MSVSNDVAAKLAQLAPSICQCAALGLCTLGDAGIGWADGGGPWAVPAAGPIFSFP